MKRYTIRASNDTAGLVVDKDDNGGWVKFTEAQARIEQLGEALRPVKEAIDHIPDTEGGDWDDPTWNENYTLNIGLRVSEIRLITKALINQTNE